MTGPVDTGKRRVVAQCDLFGIIADKRHYRTFDGETAIADAKAFLKTSNLSKRGYIEVVTEVPKIIITSSPALSPPDPDQELAEMVAGVTAALKAKTTKDSHLLRVRLFALQRLLSGRLA